MNNAKRVIATIQDSKHGNFNYQFMLFDGQTHERGLIANWGNRSKIVMKGIEEESVTYRDFIEGKDVIKNNVY